MAADRSGGKPTSNGGNLQTAAQTVRSTRSRGIPDHEGGEGFALDVLSDDEERTAGVRSTSSRAVADDFLEHGQEVLHGADFLVVDEDIGVCSTLVAGHSSRRRTPSSRCR